MQKFYELSSHFIYYFISPFLNLICRSINTTNWQEGASLQRLSHPCQL